MAQKTNINFRESLTIIEAVDALSEDLGTNRSTFIREAIRAKLRAESDAVKKETLTPP